MISLNKNEYQSKQVPDWVLQDCSVLVEHLMVLSIKLLKEKRELFGNGCLLTENNMVRPLLFTNEPAYKMSDNAFHSWMIESLKEQVITSKAKASALAMDAKIDINDKQYNAIMIMLFHKDANSKITYINPYIIKKRSFQPNNITVELVDQLSYIDIG